MTIGFAILLAAILFLIDRNHVWPQVWHGVKVLLKISAALLIIGGIVWGGYVAWTSHTEKKERIAFDPSQPYTSLYDATHRRPAIGEAIDCYSGYILQPDESLAFGGRLTGCGPNYIPRPKSERANLPPAELQHVERIEACQKQVGSDPNSTPAKFKACQEIE